MVSPSTLRKRKERNVKASLGIKKVVTELSKNEWKMLREICEFRGGYDNSEAIRLFIRREFELVQELKESIGKCSFCSNPLPIGCKGTFKGHGQCFLTQKAKKLSL